MKLSSALVLFMGLTLGAQGVPKGNPTSIPVTDAYVDDPVLAKVIAPLKSEIQATYDKVIAHCPGGLAKGTAGKEGGLGYWIVDAMRARAEALTGTPVKFAYTNSGGIRADIRPGAVKVGDIVEVMPFENELVVAELTGAEVVEVVKEGLFHRTLEPMSGIRVVTVGSQEHPALRITWSDGSAIDPAEVVRLATSDYLLASSAVLKKSRHPLTTGVTLRQLLLDLCVSQEQQGKALVAPPLGRVAVAPEILKNMKKDRQGN